MARRTFGQTWWGTAWLQALEQRALANPNRLARGRTYARQGRVNRVELSPGLVVATVRGTDIYTTSLSVRLLGDAEWDRVLDLVMTRAANSAALLAGEVPHAIGDLLLPGHGDIGPDCTCPDRAEPCKHAAALCYLVADLFDEDPFALLSLRGRGRGEVLAEVRRRRSKVLGAETAEQSNLPRGADPGTPAAAAFKRTAAADSDPEADRIGSRPVPRSPRVGVQYRLAVAPPADSGIDISALRELVADAADRAWRMLATGDESGLGASIGDDVVRRAARSTSEQSAAIASATGLTAQELALAAQAWRVGGRSGHRVGRDRWQPTADELEPGLNALGRGAKARANRVSLGPLQLRLDPDRLWWRFDSDERLDWLLTAGPASDPAELLAPVT